MVNSEVNKQTLALLHLYEVEENFSDDMNKKTQYYHESYMLTSGIGNAIYGKDNSAVESNANKVLTRLEEKKYVSKEKSAHRSPGGGKKPYVYSITEEGKKYIEDKWREISEKEYTIIFQSSRREMRFEEILLEIYSHKKYPSFVKLYRYFVENSGRNIHEMDAILKSWSCPAIAE